MADTPNHPHAGAPVGHDTSDISVRGILISAAVLAAVCVLSGIIVLALFRYIDREIVSNEPRVAPLAAPTGQLPPAPRLQTNERGDLATFRADEEKQLTTYGWVDEKAGVTRIPIERAKALLVERGLPVRQ